MEQTPIDTIRQHLQRLENWEILPTEFIDLCKEILSGLIVEDTEHEHDWDKSDPDQWKCFHCNTFINRRCKL